MNKAGATRFGRDWVYLAALLLGLLLLKAWLTRLAGLEMHFDEAQYWTWAQRPDWSYATKGPLVAWLIAASEGLFGHGGWQVRLPGWIAADLFLLVLYGFARDLWQSRAAGWWALLLGLTTPLYAVLGMVMTTDILLFLCWSLGLWAAYRALILERPLYWYGLGAAVGLGVLTKLSIGLLPAAVGLFVLLHPAYRRWLGNPHVWGGILLLLCIASPVIGWNAQHGWVMFRHDAGHIAQQGWSLARVGEFLLGQWLVLSPLVVALAVGRLWRRPVAPAGRFLWIVSLGCWVFFLLKAASAHILLNWPGAVYIGFVVLFAGEIERLSRRQRGLLLGGLGSSLLIVLLALFPAWFGLSEAKMGLKKLRAWRAPVTQLAEQAGPVDFLLAPDYRLASELWFYWPTRTRVYLWGNPGRRFNQYDIWAGPERERGGTGLFVSEQGYRLVWLAQDFARCDKLAPVRARTPHGERVRTLYAVRCQGFKPVETFKPGRF